jgi:hypothetical protein
MCRFFIFNMWDISSFLTLTILYSIQNVCVCMCVFAWACVCKEWVVWSQVIKFWIQSISTHTCEKGRQLLYFSWEASTWLYVILQAASNNHRCSEKLHLIQCLHCSWCPWHPNCKIFFLWRFPFDGNTGKLAGVRSGASSEWVISTRSEWSLQKLWVCAPFANLGDCATNFTHVVFPNLHEESDKLFRG